MSKELEKEYSWYFTVTLIYAAYKSIMALFLIVPLLNCLVGLFSVFVGAVWICFSIVMIILFLSKKLPAYYWGFALYHVVSYLIVMFMNSFLDIMFPDGSVLGIIFALGTVIFVLAAEIILSIMFKARAGS